VGVSEASERDAEVEIHTAREDVRRHSVEASFQIIQQVVHLMRGMVNLPSPSRNEGNAHKLSELLRACHLDLAILRLNSCYCYAQSKSST
jgi:hypothetical protein